MGAFRIQVSQLAKELLSRQGSPEASECGPEERQARLVEAFREARRPEIADAMASWIAGGPDVAVRIRSEEWEELMGDAIWSGEEED